MARTSDKNPTADKSGHHETDEMGESADLESFDVKSDGVNVAGSDDRKNAASHSDSFRLLRSNVDSVLSNLSSTLVSDEQRDQLRKEFNAIFDSYRTQTFDEFNPEE
jgi:hypothetical protein